MSRVSLTLLLMLLLFGAWSARLAFQHRHFNPDGLASSNPDTAGRVWGWGFNTCGQLGIHPGKGPDLIEYYIDHPRRIDGLPHIQAIASGKRHSLALDNEGRVWAWGENSDTELGERIDLSKDGSPACDNEYGRGTLAGFTAVPRLVPGIGKAVAIAAGYNSSAAIDEHGDVWVWGRH